MKKDSRGSVLEGDFHSCDVSSDMNRPFTNSFIREMLEGKDYCRLDMAFLLVACFINQWTALEKHRTMTKLQSAFRPSLSTDGIK